MTLYIRNNKLSWNVRLSISYTLFLIVNKQTLFCAAFICVNSFDTWVQNVEMVVKQTKHLKREGSADEQESTPPKQQHIDFNVIRFQKRLRKEECFEALKQFVQLCQRASDDDDPAAKFLREGGDLIFVLKTIDRSETRDNEETSTVFSAVHILLLRVLTKVPEQRENAIEMGNLLLNRYMNVIHNLLNSKRKVIHKKVVLQLLTAVVTLSVTLAKYVLNHVNFRMEVIDEIVLMARVDDSRNVRICFIQFLMAFLVEGNLSITRLLLDKRLILTSIIPHLVFDPSYLVIFVLTTLRTKVVEEIKISKTIKTNTFNTRVMSQLLWLYEWSGPAAFGSRWQNNRSNVSLEQIVDQTQQEAVAEAVHALLLVLCTSQRYGLIFHNNMLDITNSKENVVVSTVLKELGQPWEHTLKSDLAIQIVRTCPAHAVYLYNRIASVLEPRPSSPWIKAINFVTELLASIKLHGLTCLPHHIALKSAKALAAPYSIVFAVRSGLIHEHPIVRQKTVYFLQAMLHTTESCLTALMDDQSVNFREHVMKMLPNDVKLRQAWMKTESTPEGILPIAEVPIPTPVEQMRDLVDLMLLYLKHFPLLLEKGEIHQALAKTLAQLHASEDTSSNAVALQVSVQIIHILTSLDTYELEPGKAEFSMAISVLLHASCKNDALSVEAQHALGALLLKHRVLEPAAADVTGELGIWLQNFQMVKLSQRPKVISFLQNILVKASLNSVLYVEQALKALEETATAETKQVSQVDLADRLFQELLGFVANEKSCLQEPMKHVKEFSDREIENFKIVGLASTIELSAVLMSVLDSLESQVHKAAPVEKYLSYVLVHLLHLQADPLPFISVVGHWKSIPPDLMKYFNSWSTKHPIALTIPFASCTPESSLSRALLESDNAIPELEVCSDPLTILSLVRLVVFHLAQLAKREMLTEALSSACLDAFMALQHALQETISHDDSSLIEKYFIKFFSLILKHPVLLHYFVPLHTEEQLTEKLVTNLLLDFLERTTNLNQSAVFGDSNILLKKKFLRNVFQCIEKVKKQTITKTQAFITAARTLTLTGFEMSNLISKLENRIMKQPWIELISYQLCKVDCVQPKQIIALGNNLAEQLRKEGDGSPAWSVADSLYQYLQRFPLHVHQVPSNLFEVVTCKRGLKLANIILHNQSSYVSTLATLFKYRNSILASPKVVCSLLSTAKQHGPLPFSLLKPVYRQYKQDILGAMAPPLSTATCFAEHPDVVQEMIQRCMAQETRHTLCQSLTENLKDLKLCTSFHLSVIHGLQVVRSAKKELERIRSSKEFASGFIELLLHQLKQMIQMKAPSSLIIQLCSLLKIFLIQKDGMLCHEVERSLVEDWNVLLPLVLQSGLSGSDIPLTCNLFSAFALLLWRVKAMEVAIQVFEMITSHSRFLDIILVQERAGLKLAVLQLLLMCCKLSPQVLKSAQVPIFLGAYGATLSHSDQVILKILHCFSTHQDVNLNAYRPFLWGEAAINHYSVRSQAGMSLWREPKATAALELLQETVIKNTIENFPLHRSLFLTSLNNEHCDILTYVENLEPCQQDVYDPAFMMPLLSHIMAPESVVKVLKFGSLGALALTLTALTSQCKYMREAAMSVLSRFHDHLNPKKCQAQLYDQFLEALRAGIRNLKVGKVIPKIPNVSAVFLAHASLIISNPTHTMYQPLNKYLMAKPALDLKNVPEFRSFLRPASPHFRHYQKWFLKTVRYGMRTEEDVAIARNCNFLKVLLVLFSSTLPNAEIKTLILHCIEAILSIPRGSVILIECGILPWLHSVFNRLQKEENSDLILAFIRVTLSLKEYTPLVSMVIPFLKKLPRVMKYRDILSVLEVALISPKYISQDHLTEILCVCQRVLDQKIIEECSAQLGFRSGIVTMSDIPIVHSEALSSDKESIGLEDQAKLSDFLKKVVFSWLKTQDEMLEPDNIISEDF